MNIPLKSSNISYSLNAVRKTLSVPLLKDNFHFGTDMQDPVWEKAGTVNDFVLYRKDTLPEKKTVLSFFRTDTDLYLGLYAEESELDRIRHPADSVSAWNGDMVEIFFGSMGPDPWLMQLALGITGIRFDSTGGYDFWEARTFETKTGWGAEIRIPLNRLRLTEGGICFQLCRQAVKRNEFSVWSPLYKRFHETENFGELLFGSYPEIAQLRTGLYFAKEMNRRDFEAARAQWETAANKTIHGPYLSFPEKDRVCVNWETAGRVPGYVEYRRKGTSEILRSNCAKEGGILLYDTLHFTQLTGLLPDTDYEYRTCTLLPVVETISADAKWHLFRTIPADNKTFSFFSFSDLHSKAEFLRDALKLSEANNASFHLSVGDNLSHAAGRECLFEGVINPFVEANQKRKKEIPLVFVRGNHEQLGAFASEYFHVMRHPSGRTWYTFFCADTMFVSLDSGDDKMDSETRLLFSNSEMMLEEKEFLKGVTASQEYKNARFRIILVHIPPLQTHPWVPELIRPLLDAEVKPDLMICGHEHKYARINGSVNRIISPQPEESQWASELESMPFTTLIHSTRNVFSFEVGAAGISVKVKTLGTDCNFHTQDLFEIPYKI